MEHNHITLPEGSIEKTTTTLNIGPTHPATHGVFQNIMEVDGERVVSSEQTVGYITVHLRNWQKEDPCIKLQQSPIA
jgi:NADH-quinone oxidoreductase subunit D